MKEIHESFRKIGDPDDRFDIQFWQSQGDEAIFEAAWACREKVNLLDLKISFISKKDLIRAKEASGRPQALIDLNNLKKSAPID